MAIRDREPGETVALSPEQGRGDGMPSPERLAEVPLFRGLPAGDLLELAGLLVPRTVERGTLVIREGEAGTGLYLVEEGEVEVLRRTEGGETLLALLGPGTFFGELSLLEGVPASASVRAAAYTRLLVLPPQSFQAILANRPSTSLVLLRTALGRIRATEGALIQREKLASLGTLAAGISGELEDPAATLRRGVEQLRSAIDLWELRSARLGPYLENASSDLSLLPWLLRAEEPSVSVPDPDRRAREDALARWLHEHGAEGTEVAPGLADGGWTPSLLEEAVPGLHGDPERRDAIVRWLAGRGELRDILASLSAAAESVTRVVRALRGRGGEVDEPVRMVDVPETLRGALAVLGRRIPPGISVEWHVREDLPRIPGRKEELTLAWVELMENAVEAMGDRGTLRITAARSADGVRLEIGDTGPGVPEKVRHRIFDPFYSTRSPASGRGLGLHLVRGTVVDRHRGGIEVRSDRSGTTVQVSLIDPGGPRPPG